MEKQDIKSMTQEELRAFLVSLGEKPFRTAQIYQWMHEKLASSFDDMTNLSKALRQKLQDACEYVSLEKVRVQISQIDGTRKYLFRLADGNVIESVLMRYKHGNSVCISSQVGCRMGCRFCASTIGGLVRNLTASEMLEQIYATSRITGERISHVVVMGTGEPLDNYENLIRFLRLLIDENGYNLSARNITVSSCGIVPRIYDLAKEDIPITFALSLHAPTDEERKELMPVAHQYTLAETLDACREYFRQTGRRVTFEYSLVKGKNDTEEQARKLAKLLAGMNCHVNLIPINPVEEREYERSDSDSVEKFKSTLAKYHINATIRKSMGSDIDAACGQLRRKYAFHHQEDSHAF